MVIHRCECCNFSTVYKQVYNTHLQSKRHNELIHYTNNNDKKYNICKCCGKKYKYYSALWKHKKGCIPKVENNIELIESMMLEKITELQNQLVPFIQNTTQPQNVSVANEFELENKSKRIELLEKTYLKKQKRHHFEDNNVIYVVTTEDNKLRRNYIVGKARNLTNRLSTYNKTAEHEVVYYKKCSDEYTMNIVEIVVIKKLEKYRECANRDRFILPEGADISLFTNIVDSCISFIDDDDK